MNYKEKIMPTANRQKIAELLLTDLAKSNKRVLDLGAGHCSYSIVSHNLGMKVTAMDARTVRVPKLPKGIKFVNGNFLEADVPGDFDLILMLGIFYHLTLEEQHVLMEKYRGKNVLLDTHYCSNADSKAYDNNGYRGIDYQEGPDNETMIKNPKASFTCLRSFWHTEDSLVNKFLPEYFSSVEKILPEHHPYRTFFICTP